MNRLNFEWTTRKGSKNKTERNFFDYVIDNEPLSEKFGDYVSGLGCFLPGTSEKVVTRLLLKEESDFSNNRRSLYVCPECGDLGCGAISILIQKSENKIIWKEFAYENNYSDDLSIYEFIEPFIFDWQEYQEKLTNLLTELKYRESGNLLDK